MVLTYTRLPLQSEEQAGKEEPRPARPDDNLARVAADAEVVILTFLYSYDYQHRMRVRVRVRVRVLFGIAAP